MGLQTIATCTVKVGAFYWIYFGLILARVVFCVLSLERHSVVITDARTKTPREDISSDHLKWGCKLHTALLILHYFSNLNYRHNELTFVRVD